MKERMQSYYRIFLLRMLCMQAVFFCITAQAQSDTFGVYIAPNAAMYVHGPLQVSIMSKVINAGTFGTVKGSTVNMLGDYWRNDPGASFPDEGGIHSFSGTGGVFRFAGNFLQQHLAGGYSVKNRQGAVFPNLTVANNFGLYLLQSDAAIRTRLHFENGLLGVNGNNLIIGEGNNPGTITGYTEYNFVATGNTPSGGHLYRPNISNASGSVVFPVGTQAGSYAPVLLMFNASSPQDIGVRVWDNIHRYGNTGTTGSPASVQQTWHITYATPGKIPAVVALQHMNAKEGAAFSSHRQNSYISRFDAVTEQWDTLPPSGATNPGTLTTGTPIAGAYLHTRSFDSLGHDTYLTKNADTRTDSITLAKAALIPVRQPDGSFQVSYQFILQNRGSLPLRGIQILDSLDKVFPIPARYAVVSVTVSGKLVANPSYDGSANADLLLPASTMQPFKTDTVLLVLNVTTDKKEGYYYNNAIVKGIVQGFGGREYVVDNKSVDGITPPDPGAPPVPTPVTLTASRYAIQQGLSPNGDGVNDLFTIGNLGNDKAAVWIFTKHGILVYRSADYKNDWDGTANQGGASSKKVEEGTYFYKIIITESATGKQETFYGFLSVWK